jgi:hypothetical protein
VATGLFIYLGIGVIHGVMAWFDFKDLASGEGAFVVTDSDGEEIAPKDDPSLFAGVAIVMVFAAIALWPIGILIKLSARKKKN